MAPPFVDLVETVLDYLRLLGFSVSKTVLRGEFASCSDYPNLTLASLVAVLDRRNIPNAPFTVPPEQIRHVPPPFLAWMNDPMRSDRGRLVIVTRTGEEGLEYRDRAVSSEMTWEIFLRQWRNILLIAEYADTAQADDPMLIASEDKVARRYEASIRRIPDFLDGSECDSLIRLCEEGGLFSRSPLADGKGDAYFGRARTSDTALMSDRANPLLRGIYAKGAQLADTLPEYCEHLQCVRYEPGQEFRPHHDASSCLMRTHTLLIYLNDGFDGGETIFPEIGLSVAPAKGLALLFPNLGADLEILPESCHAAAPVRRGRKYACNLWIRSAPVVDRDASR